MQTFSPGSGAAGGIESDLVTHDAADPQQHPDRDDRRRARPQRDKPRDRHSQGCPGRGDDRGQHDRPRAAAHRFRGHASGRRPRDDARRCDAIAWAALRALRHPHQVHRGRGVSARTATGRGRPAGGAAGRAHPRRRADADGGVDRRGATRADRCARAGAGRQPDGHRLAVRKLPANGAGDLEASLIVPARALAELARVLKGEPGRVEMIISKARNQIFFRAGSSELTSRLIDGKYPNYAQVIPSKSSTTVKVATSELTQTVRAVSLFARDSANVIRVKAQAGTLVLSATTNEVGDSRAEMPADVDGSEIQIAFNARYVLDALGVIGEDEVELLFDGPLSPGLLRPPGKEHYLYVIMPVRVAMS